MYKYIYIYVCVCVCVCVYVCMYVVWLHKGYVFTGDDSCICLINFQSALSLSLIKYFMAFLWSPFHVHKLVAR